MKFQKAVKERLKARVALEGPTGSGKTWTALEWATVLADGGDVAVIDTEHRSASYYADKYSFDTLHWPPPYDPTQLARTIREAADDYAVVVVDSFTHYWSGEGGTLDIVDAAGKRNGGNNFAGWKTATPAFRHLIDTVLAAPCHVICTMRSKMEYVLEQQRGKDGRTVTVPRKVGMAPEMRAGIEFEFTLVGELDVEHNLTITKSRCHLVADKVAQPHRAGELAEVFAGWLDTGSEPVETPPETPPTPPQPRPAAAQQEAGQAPLAITYTPAKPRSEVPALVADDEAQKAANGHSNTAAEVPLMPAGRKLADSQRFAIDLENKYGVDEAIRHSLYAIVTGNPNARYSDLSGPQRNKVVKYANQMKQDGITLEQLTSQAG